MYIYIQLLILPHSQVINKSLENQLDYRRYAMARVVSAKISGSPSNHNKRVWATPQSDEFDIGEDQHVSWTFELGNLSGVCEKKTFSSPRVMYI